MAILTTCIAAVLLWGYRNGPALQKPLMSQATAALPSVNTAGLVDLLKKQTDVTAKLEHATKSTSEQFEQIIGQLKNLNKAVTNPRQRALDRLKLNEAVTDPKLNEVMKLSNKQQHQLGQKRSRLHFGGHSRYPSQRICADTGRVYCCEDPKCNLSAECKSDAMVHCLCPLYEPGQGHFINNNENVSGDLYKKHRCQGTTPGTEVFCTRCEPGWKTPKCDEPVDMDQCTFAACTNYTRCDGDTYDGIPRFHVYSEPSDAPIIMKQAAASASGDLVMRTAHLYSELLAALRMHPSHTTNPDEVLVPLIIELGVQMIDRITLHVPATIIVLNNQCQ